MKKIIIIISLFFFLFSCNSEKNYKQIGNNEIINVKYREEPLNISSFESIDTSMSSWIRWASYDKNDKYLILDFKWTNYHYCWVPLEIWEDFKGASSFGKYYNRYIKWNFDCRNFNF